MAVVPLQFYPQFDIQIGLQKMFRKHIIIGYICYDEIKIVKECTHANGKVSTI